MPRKSKKQQQLEQQQLEVQPTQQHEPLQQQEPNPVQQLQVHELIQEIEKDDDSIIIAPKGKRKVSQKTLDALARGRDKLAEKWKVDKVKNEELKEVYAIKKANKVIKQKLKIKQNIGVEDEDDIEEQPIKLIQPIKKKKQQIIVLPEISDDEEEIIIKKEKKQSKQLPGPEISKSKNIIFF